MANVSNLNHQTMNGMRNSNIASGESVLVSSTGALHHQPCPEVESKSAILQQHTGGVPTVTDIEGNFIHEILGMNSQIEIIDDDGPHQGLPSHHHEVIVHHQQAAHQQHPDQGAGQQQIHIQNATPEQLLELQQQGSYVQENGNRVIVVSELFKCDICNLAFIFKDHYIQHCDDHIRMVAEHINLKGIVPINNFEEANEILDFRSSEDNQQQQHSNIHGLTVDHGTTMGNEVQEHQQISVGHGAQLSNAGATNVIPNQQQLVHATEMDNGHGVMHIGPGGQVLDASMIEDIDEGDPQLSGSSRSASSTKSSKRTSQQQLQAQLNSEWCKCLPCDFKFRTPLSLSRHLNAHMENRNRCEKCNKFFTSYVSLNTHSRQCRADEEPVQNVCDSETGSAAACERGRSISVDGPATSPGGSVMVNKVYNCKKCNVQFASANQYRDHKLKHSNDVYTCNECQKAFLSIINLNRHRQNEHQQRQTFVCTICNCEFTNVQFLEEHNKTRSHLHNLSAGSADNDNRSAPRTGDVVVID